MTQRKKLTVVRCTLSVGKLDHVEEGEGIDKPPARLLQAHVVAAGQGVRGRRLRREEESRREMARLNPPAGNLLRQISRSCI